MDTELLKTFLEVEKTRHFGRAAENLCVTPAAVSARIRQLEDIVGLPLLIRGKNKMGLTPAGEKLKPRAQEVLEALARAVQEPGSRNGPGQQFCVGASHNLWDCVVADFLCATQSQQPDLSVRAECHDSGYLISQLQSRQLDIAFMFDPLALEGLRCEQVATLPFSLLSTQAGTTVEDVEQDNYVLVDWSVGFEIEHNRVVGGRWQPRLVTSTGRVARAYLAAFGGAGFFPRSWAADGASPVRLHAVRGTEEIALGLFMLYLDSNRRKHTIESLRDFF